jgi:hypothetical protein
LVPQDGVIRINADGVSGLSVDLLDERFQLLAGFAGGQVAGSDGLDCSVNWTGKSLAELGGQSVRVQVSIQKTDEALPRVYALYLGASEVGS